MGGGAIYSYAEDAKKDYANKIDVITSFDVIEHVTDPLAFLRDIYDLLSPDGTAIIGTPTRTPVTRALLGEVYEKIVLYTAQHLWIFSEDSLRRLSKQAGFSEFSVRYFQKWDITNLLAWLQYRKPMSVGSEDWNTKSNVRYDFVTPTLNEVYKRTLEEHALADYMAIYLKK